jgi:hypothetical protein
VTEQGALLAILVGRVIETDRWAELEGWLRTMLDEARCGASETLRAWSVLADLRAREQSGGNEAMARGPFIEELER